MIGVMCGQRRNRVLKQLVTVVLFGCGAFSLLAQIPCTQVLQQAQATYESGVIVQIPEQLAPCIEEKGFTKEEEIRAKKLNTLVHIFSDSVSASESAMITFLRADPEHQLDPVSDPREFFYLYSKFRTKPIYRIRISVGGNYTLINTSTAFGVENLTSNLEDPQTGIHFTAKAEIEKEFFDRIEISTGIQGSFRNFGLNNNVLPLGDYAKYQLSESQLSLDIPLSLRFLFLVRKRVQPYVGVGWAPSFLLTSTLKGDREAGQTINLTGENLLSKGLRKFVNYYAFTNVGFRYRFAHRKSFLFAEVSYQQILNNMSNPENRYSDEIQELPFRFAYVDNDFSLSMFQVNVGLILSVYRPKKLNKYKSEWEIAIEDEFKDVMKTKEEKKDK